MWLDTLEAPTVVRLSDMFECPLDQEFVKSKMGDNASAISLPELVSHLMGNPKLQEYIKFDRHSKSQCRSLATVST